MDIDIRRMQVDVYQQQLRNEAAAHRLARASRTASVRAMRRPGSRGRSVRCAGSSGPPRRSDPADERQPIAPRWPVERR